MRSISIALVLLLAAPGFATTKAENRKVAQVDTLELQDTVFKLKEEEHVTRVYFSLHAGIYSISKKLKNYSQILTAVTKSKDTSKPVSFVVNVNTLEIQEITLQKQPSQE